MEVLLWCESHATVPRTVALLSTNTKSAQRRFVFAESKGFEPLEPVRARQFSKLLLSTTQPTLHFISSWLRVEQVRPPP
jgi:hypothetical protein